MSCRSERACRRIELGTAKAGLDGAQRAADPLALTDAVQLRERTATTFW